MKGLAIMSDPIPGAATEILWPPLECDEDPASCDCAWHENMREAEASHHAGGQEDVVHFAERIAFEQQLAMPEIPPPPPPPPPPEEYMRAQAREAHTILSRLHTSFGHQLPNNIYMAMAYLQIEITTAEKGGAHASG